MFIFILFFLLLSCLSNAKLAKAKNLNTIAYGMFTFFAFFVGIFLACSVLCIIMINKNPELYQLVQNQDKAGMNAFILKDFNANSFLYSTLIMAGAFGGYLLIRYLIEKKKIVSK